MACRLHRPLVPQPRSRVDLGPPLPTVGATSAVGIDRPDQSDLSEQLRGKHKELSKGKRGERKRGEGWKGPYMLNPFSFFIDGGHKSHKDSDELCSNMLDGFPEKIDPSQPRGKHKEMRKGKGKRGERKRGEGWKGQDFSNPFSFFIDVGQELHKGSNELRSSVLDGFPEKIDPSKQSGMHEEMKKKKGKRGKRKRGEGWKGQGLSNPFSVFCDVGHKLHRGSDELHSNVLDDFSKKIDPSKAEGLLAPRKTKKYGVLRRATALLEVNAESPLLTDMHKAPTLEDLCPTRKSSKKGKAQKLNHLRRLEKLESSTSSPVEKVERVLGHLFKKATAEELKVLQNVFDSGPGSNSWMATFKNETDKQERSLIANLF